MPAIADRSTRDSPAPAEDGPGVAAESVGERGGVDGVGVPAEHPATGSTVPVKAATDLTRRPYVWTNLA